MFQSNSRWTSIMHTLLSIHLTAVPFLICTHLSVTRFVNNTQHFLLCVCVHVCADRMSLNVISGPLRGSTSHSACTPVSLETSAHVCIVHTRPEIRTLSKQCASLPSRRPKQMRREPKRSSPHKCAGNPILIAN